MPRKVLNPAAARAVNTADANDNFVELYAADATLAEDVARLKRGNVAAGVNLAADPHPFVYSAYGGPGWTSAVSRGLVSQATQADTDGRVAMAVSNPSRFATVNYESHTTGAPYTSTYRLTVFDVAVGGQPSIYVTGTFTVTGAVSYAQIRRDILGVVDVSAAKDGTKYRIRTFNMYDTGPWQGSVSLVTATVDVSNPAVPVLGFTVDRNDQFTNSGTYVGIPTPQSGANARRRAYLIGEYGAMFVRTRQEATPYGQVNNAGFTCAERAPGSNVLSDGSFADQGNNPAFSVDRLTGRHFAVLQDGSEPNANPFMAGRVTIFAADDKTRGAASTVRLGNAMSGAARLCTLSADLIACSFVTGSTNAGYVVKADGAGGFVKVGSPDVAGPWVTVCFDMFPYKATAVALLKNLTGWLAQITTVSVNPAAAPGVSPYAQVAQTPTFPLGQTLAAAASGDTIVLGAMERLSSDRIVVAYRNSTRALWGTEVFDLVAAA